jgi:Ca2+-binding EF-hand superfamily protein
MTHAQHHFRPIHALLATLLCSAPTLALAQGQAPMTFERLDRDGDGAVTEQEFTATHDERMRARAAQGMPMGGGAGPPSFTAFDQDGDGRLTPAEFAAGRQARMQQMQGMRGPGSGMGPSMGPGVGPGMTMPRFADFDTDGDGSLGKQELYDARAAHMRERARQGFPMRNAPNAPTFEAIDADGDGDGRVSPQEFADAQGQRHRKMMQSAPAQP